MKFTIKCMLLIFVILTCLPAFVFAGNQSWSTSGPYLGESVYGIVIDTYNHSRILAGFYENQVFAFSDYEWSQSSVGLSNFKLTYLFGDSNSDTLFAAGLSTGDVKPVIYRSRDNGGYWMQHSVLQGSELNYPTYGLVSKFDASNIYLSLYFSGIMYSTDGGKVWTKSSGGSKYVNCIVAHPVSQQILYSGSDEGVHKSTDGGKTWKLAGTSSKMGVSSVVVHPVNPETLYVGVNGGTATKGVWASLDGGDSWTITKLSGKKIAVLALDEKKPSRIFAGTNKNDAFKTENGGAGWTDISTGLPSDFSASSMAIESIDTKNVKVYMGGTDGNVYSYIISSDNEPPSFANTTVLENTSKRGPFDISSTITDPSKVNEKKVYIVWSLDNWKHSKKEVMSTLGQDVYNGKIPSMYFADTLQYYIQAEDMVENVGTDPAGAPGNNYSFYLILAPTELQGKLQQQDTTVVLSWKGVNDVEQTTVAYDDGKAEDLIWWTGGGAGWAVDFQLPFYPAKILSGTFWVGNNQSPPTTKVAVHLWDDDGVMGKPGTKLTGPDSLDAVPGQWNTIDYSTQDIVIYDGDIYFGYLQTEADYPQQGFDGSSPIDYRGWAFNGMEWTPLSNQSPPINEDPLIRITIIPFDGDGGDNFFNNKKVTVLDRDKIIHQTDTPRKTVNVKNTMPVPLVCAAQEKNNGGLDEKTDPIKYKIYRKTQGSGDPFACIDSVESNLLTYQDINPPYSEDVWYAVTARYFFGESAKTDSVKISILGVNGEDGKNKIPFMFKLSQNFPNPFNPSTIISFSVPEKANGKRTSLKIYDVHGSLIKTMVEGVLNPGNYSITWNGKNQNNMEVSSGIYYYMLSAGDEHSRKKMVLLK